MAVLLIALLMAARQSSPVAIAASKFAPGVKWQSRSVVTADFTCGGHKQQAIVGVSAENIVIAVFVNGPSSKPELLRYSAGVRNVRTIKLTTEDLDFDPVKDEGFELPGFQRSRRCKGLNLSDGEIDSAHIYWNHDAKRFDDWTR